MFQYAESDPTLSHDDAKAQEQDLRVALLQEQYRRLQAADQTLLIVLAGIDGAGKGSTINLLNTWLDPRHIHTLAFGELTHQEAMRPAMWRYWRDLPRKGQTGVVFGSWYGSLLAETARKHPDPAKVAMYARVINRFEAMLAAEGVQVLKLWFHLSRKAQKERADHMLKDPETAWRVSHADLKVRKKFDRLRSAGELAISQTHRSHAPWVVVPSADEDMRTLSAAQAILSALKRGPARRIQADEPLPATLLPLSARPPKIPPLKKSTYEDELQHWQSRLAHAVRSKHFTHRSLVLAFEGLDAAGKGGSIRRVTAALDVRNFDIHPISAPLPYEFARPYLWRFWRELPAHGKIAIFDRSWYGRVLVERVEKLIPPKTVARAYDEINDFELQLAANGTLLLKFWLDVSKDEQLRRFREREESPFKSFKITPDDWRNRARWKAYQGARFDMLTRTSTEHAPWHIVQSDDKLAARVHIVKTIALALEDMHKRKSRFQEPDADLQVNVLS